MITIPIESEESGLKHSISDAQQKKYKLTEAQKIFLEVYLSNGMVAYPAIKKTLELTSDIRDKDDRYYQMRAARMLEGVAVVNYLDDWHKKRRTKISIDDVLNTVNDIMTNPDEDSKNRLKAAELLMKHLGGFAKNNEQKASKSLTIINNKSEKEIDEELRKVLTLPKNSTKDIIEVEEI